MEEPTSPEPQLLSFQPEFENQTSRNKARQRITRACDTCNRRRVKCDGKFPCSRCRDVTECKYARSEKKRGKPVGRGPIVRQNSSISIPGNHISGDSSTNGAQGVPDQYDLILHQPEQEITLEQSPTARSGGGHASSIGMNPLNHASVDRAFPGKVQAIEAQYQAPLPSGRSDLSEEQQQGAIARVISSLTPDDAKAQAIVERPHLEDRHNNFAGPNPAPRVSRTFSRTVDCRFPVLKPLLPHTTSFLKPSEACGLLELYFTSSFEKHAHPICRHVHAFIFRKSSVLSTISPRRCSPALLASMLWAAAETGGAETLLWSYSRRRSVCNRLRTLSIQLLRPLTHTEARCADCSQGGIPNSHCKCKQDTESSEWQETRDILESGPFHHDSGSLDDVVTYIHVAAITSASEHKAASMRWWHAAFALARELKFNIEVPLPTTTTSGSQQGDDLIMEVGDNPWTDLNNFNFDINTLDFSAAVMTSPPGAFPARDSNGIDEEQKEERRRTWWLLYIQDRHLALCYNRNLALLDAECADLLLPLAEYSYQSGAFLTENLASNRLSFPSLDCTGHNIFGFFLPLMTIVGEVLDHQQRKTHPLLGQHYQNQQHASAVEDQISMQLALYKESLIRFEAMNMSVNSTLDRKIAQDNSHTETVIAYSRFLVDVLHILLAGKMDPVSLFDNRDLWTSSQSFLSTMNHAIQAAEDIRMILDIDPDLSFMPYFTGIQLLQGSFVLLLIIDRLETKTDPRVITACETIIRATEACVTTLETEYQRNYRQILQSAVAQARGRYVPEKESQYRRMAVLAMYRWTRNGTGLAL